jgi:DNA-binding response OmpR family regulator
VPPKPGSLADRLATSTAVLVVEDEPDIADFMAAFFRASGMDMVHVNPRTTADVLTVAERERITCVLLDINLGRLSGLDVLAELRAHRTLASLPVIVVSALSDRKTIERARQLGVTGYVAKPFSVSSLFEEVMAVVSGDGALRDSGVLGRSDLDGELELALGDVETEPVGFALVRVSGAVEPVAEALSAKLPRDAVVGRSAPDELGVLLPGVDARAAVRVLAIALDGQRAVAGVASAPDHATTSDELYMAADAALAEAADRGYTIEMAR